ncbi:hypothetical protein MPER_13042 [Moniliophthora perniciosa FA553]|nr:hypothetical protein MPER_13042 [Moniliophthora perniciosa FA553]
MPAAPKDVEDDEETPFVPGDWIGAGKAYNPLELPLYVVNACLAALELPREATERLPSTSLPVMDFIKLNLPIISHSLNTYSPEAWFTEKASAISPETCVELIWKRPIPSPETLELLEGSFGQKWLDGVKGIIDPRYGQEVLPYWVLTLWKNISSMLVLQEEWQEAYETLTTVVQDPLVSEHFPTITSVLGRRSWNSNVRVGRFTFESHVFSRLLRPRMICDDVTQCMNQVLQNRLDHDPIRKKVHFIAASRFASVLQSAAKKGYTEKLPTSLKDLERRIEETPNLKVWFPTLLNKHKVAICIDFGARTIAYGDSLPQMPAPKIVIENTQKWLKACLNGPFKYLGNTLEHGVQEDFISCIPAAMNTIAHGVFGEPVWKPERRYLDRIAWFTLLVPNPEDISAHQPAMADKVHESQARMPRIPIESLLNPAEEVAWKDIVDASWEELEYGHGEVEDIDMATEDLETLITDTDNLETNINILPIANTSPETSSSKSLSPKSPIKAIKETAKHAWNKIFSKSAKAETTKKRTAKDTGSSISKKAKVVSEPDDTYASGPSGISKAARSERKAREKADAGIFDPKKREKWKRAIKQIDPKAEFYDRDLRAVWCSRCTKPIHTRTGTDTAQFLKHLEAM